MIQVILYLTELVAVVLEVRFFLKFLKGPYLSYRKEGTLSKKEISTVLIAVPALFGAIAITITLLSVFFGWLTVVVDLVSNKINVSSRESEVCSYQIKGIKRPMFDHEKCSPTPGIPVVCKLKDVPIYKWKINEGRDDERVIDLKDNGECCRCPDDRAYTQRLSHSMESFERMCKDQLEFHSWKSLKDDFHLHYDDKLDHVDSCCKIEKFIFVGPNVWIPGVQKEDCLTLFEQLKPEKKEN